MKNISLKLSLSLLLLVSFLPGLAPADPRTTTPGYTTSYESSLGTGSFADPWQPVITSSAEADDVSRGKVDGKIGVHVFGYNSGIEDVLEDVSELGVIVIPVPATAIAMELVSTSAADTGTVLSSGTDTGGSLTTLVDSGATFTSDGVAANDIILNDTDVSFGHVITVDSETQITLLPSNGTTFLGVDYRVVTPASTGVAVVMSHNLDANFDEVVEMTVMNGTTPVALTGTYIRTNNIHNIFLGSNGVGVGDVTLQSVGGATDYNKVSAGGNMTLQSLFTVPRGKTAYIASWSAGLVTVNNNTAGRVILRGTCEFSQRTNMPGVFHFHDIFADQAGSTVRVFKIPFKCPQRSDIKVSAQRVQGAASMISTSSIEMWIEDNE